MTESGAVLGKDAVSGGGTDRRSAEGGGDLVGTRPLCSLGDPDAKAAMCGTEEARKRRARRTPVGGLAVDAMAAGCGNPRCRYNKPEEAGEKGRRYRRRKEGEVSRVRHLRSILGVDRANLREREKKGGRRGEGGGGG